MEASLTTYALVGKTGHGKSTTANRLTGSELFESSDSMNTVTQSIAHQTYEADGHRFRVIDTPGVFDTKLSVSELAARLAEFTHITPDGLDAILCVVRKGRMTDEELSALAMLENLFGAPVWRHSIILFTHCKQDAATVAQEIAHLPERHLLKIIVGQAGGRVATIDNMGKESRIAEDCVKIHQMVGHVIRANDGKKYDNKLFEEARAHNEAVQRKLDELKVKCDKEVADLKARYEKGQLTAKDYQEKVQHLEEKVRVAEAKKSQDAQEASAKSYEGWHSVAQFATMVGISVVGAGALAAAAPYIAPAGLAVALAGGACYLANTSSARAATARAEEARAKTEEHEAAARRSELQGQQECAVS